MFIIFQIIFVARAILKIGPGILLGSSLNSFVDEHFQHLALTDKHFSLASEDDFL